MQVITSHQNPKIQQLRRLKHATERQQQQRFSAEGLRTVATLLESKLVCEQLYVTDQILAHWQLMPPAIEHFPAANITVVTAAIMRQISGATTPSGLLAVFQLPAATPAAPLITQNLTPAGLVLTNITDPGNVGTLIRTAVAINLPTVVTIAGADPFGPKVVQASAGTIGQIQLLRFESWSEFRQYRTDLRLSPTGVELKLHALVPQDGQNLIDPTAKLQAKNGFLVLGNEAHGLTVEQLSDCDSRLTIPMPGGAESLNAAVAGAIAMYLVHVG